MIAEESLSLTPPEIRQIAQKTLENLLPNKSKSQYEKEFQKFEEWRQQNNIQGISENILLGYFDLQRQKYKSSTLWRIYSMLRSCLSIYMDVDISKYSKLQALLKRASEGYTPKKSQILEEEDDIHKFIQEANDRIYLAIKVILIMGYNGACRREELTNLSTEDIEYKSDSVQVSIPKTKNNVPRQFLITDQHWIDLIKKYANLRPKKVTHKRFFLTYRSGCCVNSPIGINSMGKVAKEIAVFLKLPNPERFTGHCFRRSSATHLANHGGDLLTIKRHGGWKSSAVAEGYVEASIKNKIEVAQMPGSKQADSVLPGCSTISQQRSNSGTNRNISVIGNTNVHQNILPEENLHGVIHYKSSRHITCNC